MRSLLHLSLAVSIFFGATSKLRAQEPATPVAKTSIITSDAQRVFTGLLAEYETGESGGAAHLELLHTWSTRILLAQMMEPLAEGSSRVELEAKQLALHQKRLRHVTAIVEKRTLAGESSATELAADRVPPWARRQFYDQSLLSGFHSCRLRAIRLYLARRIQ